MRNVMARKCLNCGNPLKGAAQKFCCDKCRSQHHYKPDIALITAVKRFLVACGGDASVMRRVIQKGVDMWLADALKELEEVADGN